MKESIRASQERTAATLPWFPNSAPILQDPTWKPLLRDLEETLRQQQKYQIVFEHSPIAGLVIEEDGGIVETNHATAQLLGLPQSALAGMHLRQLMKIHDWEEFTQLWLAGKKAPPVRGSVRFHVGNHGELVVGLVAAPIPLAGAARPYWNMSLCDPAQWNQPVLAAQESACAAALARLAGGLANELQQLLNGAASGGTVAAASDPDISLCDGLAAVLKQLRGLAGHEPGPMTLVDTQEFLQSCEALLRDRLGPSIALTTLCSRAVGRLCVNPDALREVILILGNTVRHTLPQGGQLLLMASPGPSGSPGEVIVTVADNGQGFDQALQTSLLEPYASIPGRQPSLDLALASALVRQQRGRLHLESTPGRGTRFSLHMPGESNWMLAPGIAPTEEADGGPGGETLLIVDDNKEIRDYLVNVLSAKGYRLLQAENAEQALTLALQYQGPIHLLITDLVMPGTSGLDLAERWLSLRPKTRFLIMSGYQQEACTRLGLVVPSSFFLHKPFTPEELLRKIREELVSMAPKP